MENISFVLWVCLWPLACTFDRYLVEKRRAITKEEKSSEESVIFFQVIIWAGVAILLFSK